jgi:hypothetical protein
MRLIAPDGTIYRLSQATMTVGRDPATNDIVLNDDRVSRRHAQLQVQGTAVSISDVGSRNGTFVNGRPVTGQQPVNPGDVVSIGGLQLVYQAEHDADATQALDLGHLQPGYTPAPPQPMPQPAPVNMPVSPQPVAYPAPVYAPRPPKDRSLTIILEALPGMFGFFGIGWMYAGNVGTGLALLFGNWVYLAIGAVIATVTAGIGLCFLWPVEILFLVLSATQLNKYIKQHPELFGP